MALLEGKVALITGASRGQGAAEAELFASEGARVVLADVREEEGQALAKTLPDATYVNLDVSCEAAWKSAIELTLERYGRLDILVNNAAISSFGMIEETSIEAYMEVLKVNLIGVFLGMRAALPALKKQGGSIINVSSIAGLTGRANIAAYASSKWGVRGLSKSAALELGKYNIRVNVIVPGLIETPMTREAYGMEKLQARGATLPLGRHGQAIEIARLALFLASEQSAFCTGGEFICDGGETAGMI